MLLCLIPETYGPTVLKKKAAYLRRKENTERYRAKIEVEEKSLIKAIAHFCTRPFGKHFFSGAEPHLTCPDLLVRELICLLLCTYTAFILSILYLFFEAYPLVFMNNHGFELQFVGLAFCGLGFGELVGILTLPPIAVVLQRTLYRRKDVEELKDPERHLIPAMLGAVLLPIGMFWFAFTTYPAVPWIVPILAGIPFGWGVALGISIPPSEIVFTGCSFFKCIQLSR